MIFFPWLIAFLALLAVIVVLLNLPGAWRSARRRGEIPFAWRAFWTALLIASVVAAIFVGGILLAGGGR